MRVSFETAELYGGKDWVITVTEAVQVETWNGTRGAWRYNWTAIKSHAIRRPYGGNLKNHKFTVLVGHVLVGMPAEFGPFAPTDAEKAENPSPEWPRSAGRVPMKVRLLSHAPSETDVRRAIGHHINTHGGDNYNMVELVGHMFTLVEVTGPVEQSA